MHQNIGAGIGASADLVRGASKKETVGMSTRYEVECYDKAGNLKWADSFENLVVDAGLDDLLDKYFKGSTYTAAHYVGLKLTGTVAAADTMASHAGWAESSAYSDATRPALTLGSVSSQSVDNSGSKAVFNIDDTATITGCFLTTNNTKGGSTGTLYGGGDFSASKAVSDGDTLNVTLTLTSTAV
jgi:hypothetical protein